MAYVKARARERANNVPGPTTPSSVRGGLFGGRAAGGRRSVRPPPPPTPVAYNRTRGGDRRPGIRRWHVRVVPVWLDGIHGNSFATRTFAGLVAMMLAKHPWLTPFQVRRWTEARGLAGQTPSGGCV
jgi:hypothetical protein